MTSHLEFSARAALCRKLAKHEPANRRLWMAEAESWSRLSKVRFRGEVGATIASWQACGRVRQDACQFQRRQESYKKMGPTPNGRTDGDGDAKPKVDLTSTQFARGMRVR